MAVSIPRFPELSLLMPLPEPPVGVGLFPTAYLPTVKLEYSTDGTNYNPITGAESLAGLTFNWPAADAIDATVYIRASNTDVTKPTIPAVSNSFEIKGRLNLDSPISTDRWQVDSTPDILWTPTGTMGTIKLEYSTDGFGSVVNPIPGAANLSAGVSGVQQSFGWQIPNDIGNTVSVRITPNTATQAAVDISDTFKIVGGLNLLTPNGGSFRSE